MRTRFIRKPDWKEVGRAMYNRLNPQQKAALGRLL